MPIVRRITPLPAAHHGFQNLLQPPTASPTVSRRIVILPADSEMARMMAHVALLKIERGKAQQKMDETILQLLQEPKLQKVHLPKKDIRNQLQDLFSKI